MIDELWEKAEKLAARPYDTEFETDTYSDGEPVYLARNPELPGCMAHGSSRSEALSNLNDARADYIYSLLVDNIEVPEPATFRLGTSGQ